MINARKLKEGEIAHGVLITDFKDSQIILAGVDLLSGLGEESPALTCVQAMRLMGELQNGYPTNRRSYEVVELAEAVWILKGESAAICGLLALDEFRKPLTLDELKELSLQV